MKWDWLAGGVTRHAYYWHSYDSRVSFYQDYDARDAHGKIPSFFFKCRFFFFLIWKLIAQKNQTENSSQFGSNI